MNNSASMASVTGSGQSLSGAAAAAGSITCIADGWMGAPAPVFRFEYKGRVSTFCNASQNTYSETYEPARLTQYGPISRVESSLVYGQWRHIAFSRWGQAIAPSADIRLFDQLTLPLMYSPEVEVSFARHQLARFPGKSSVALPDNVMAYRSADYSSVGIVRLKVDLAP